MENRPLIEVGEQLGFREKKGATGNVFLSLETAYITFLLDKNSLGIDTGNSYLDLEHIKTEQQFYVLYELLTGEPFKIQSNETA